MSNTKQNESSVVSATASHTPGPWYREAHYIHANGQRFISVVSGDYPEQIEANARLIAAAPELLENLKRLVFRIDGVDGAPSIGDMEDARAAIAKATQG